MNEPLIQDVSIHVIPELVGGVFANAFRVTSDSAGDVFLDFCSYSDSDKKGVLVSRVRVHASFLGLIRDRLSSTMIEITGKTPPKAVLVKGPGQGSIN